VAAGATTRSSTPSWLQPVEWLLMVALVSVLMVFFVHFAQQTKGQAELAAIKSTVGALRTAFVIDHIQQQARLASGQAAQSHLNPFDLVQQRPSNYRGKMDAVRVADVPPGSWIFVPSCSCVGYRPLDDQWLNSPSGDPLIWFKVVGAPGVLQLVPREKYLWGNYFVD
jgi:hypothetical protein